MVRLRTSILGSFLISIDPPSKKTINIHQHIWYSWQMLAVYSEIIPKLGYMKQATLKSNGQSPWTEAETPNSVGARKAM